jgi:hypothetical protein
MSAPPSPSDPDASGVKPGKKVKIEKDPNDPEFTFQHPPGRLGQGDPSQQSRTDKESQNQTRDKEGGGQPDDGHRPSPVKSIEVDDQEPELLVAEAGTSELFPGAPCESVAKGCKKGNDDPAPRYINRYGPRHAGWLVWSTELVLPKNSSKTAADLQNVSEKFQRVLDYPREQGEQKIRSSSVLGLYNVVWDCPGLEGDPEKAVELLNPAKVKKANKYNTAQARRKFLAQPNNKLDKYPTTHANVKFSDPIQTLCKDIRNVKDPNTTTRFELGSIYRGLYRKDEIRAEYKVYNAAVHQAKKFLQWYQSVRPDDFDEQGRYRSASRDPTLQPLSVSPTPQSPTSEEGSAGSTAVEKTPAPASAKDSAPTPQPAKEKTPTPQPGQKDAPSSQANQAAEEKLSREEFREVVLEAYMMHHNIASEDKMSPKQRARFNVYFDTTAKLEGY